MIRSAATFKNLRTLLKGSLDYIISTLEACKLVIASTRLHRVSEPVLDNHSLPLIVSAGRVTTNEELENMLESGNPLIFTSDVSV